MAYDEIENVINLRSPKVGSQQLPEVLDYLQAEGYLELDHRVVESEPVEVRSNPIINTPYEQNVAYTIESAGDTLDMLLAIRPLDQEMRPLGAVLKRNSDMIDQVMVSVNLDYEGGTEAVFEGLDAALMDWWSDDYAATMRLDEALEGINETEVAREAIDEVKSDMPDDMSEYLDMLKQKMPNSSREGPGRDFKFSYDPEEWGIS